MVEPPLRRFAGLISFLGLIIVVGTFLVKDVFRERQKDLVSDFERAKGEWLLKSSLDRIELDVHSLLLRSSGGNPFNGEPKFDPESLKERISWLEFFNNTFENGRDTFHLLTKVLPKAVWKEFLNGGGERLEKFAKQVERQHFDVFHIWYDSDDGRLIENPADFEKQTAELAEAYWQGVTNTNREWVFLLGTFEETAASARRHLRTVNCLSDYVLYPLGLLVGLLGQLAGVKSPGRE